MVSLDALISKESDLNPFLFADVGTELNGSELTVLSLLARLGSDPWAEAARLAALPEVAVIDWLAECIARMPLTAQALGEARATASRLIPLLPAPTSIHGAMAGAQAGAKQMPRWAMVAVILGVLALGVAVNSMYASSPPTTPEQAVQHDQ